MDNTTSVHQLGCSIFRTGRCNCAYLTQWDTPLDETGKPMTEQRITEAQRRVAEHAHVTVSPREEKVYTCVTCQGNQAWMDSANREIRLWKQMALTIGGMGVTCVIASVIMMISREVI